MYLDGKEITGIYLGDTEISSAFVGDKEVFSSSPYVPDQVIFESSVTGTYSVNILADGNYEVYLVGGGGNGVRNQYAISGRIRYAMGSGGSGAGFIGVISVRKGVYSVVCGGNSSAFSITAGAGGNAYLTSSDRVAVAGSGGVLSVDSSVNIISSSLRTNGNVGDVHNNDNNSSWVCWGGASVYGGYGNGATNFNNYRTDGYVKIVYKGR